MSNKHSLKTNSETGFVTRTEIARWYDVTPKTLKTRLAENGLKLPPRKRISPKMLKRVFNIFGQPE